MKATISWALFGLSALFALPVLAEPENATPQAPAKSDSAKDSFGHAFQFGLRAGLLGGYNMIFRYDHSPFCATAQAGKEPQKV
ncbi:MAG TPA: hypothetical protein VHW01_15400, partial [Polyangiaceae bacterium]|nr:hypothetical protein [Polyangiaceae bacterium]